MITYITRIIDAADKKTHARIKNEGPLYEIKLKHYEPVYLSDSEMESAIKEQLSRLNIRPTKSETFKPPCMNAQGKAIS